MRLAALVLVVMACLGNAFADTWARPRPRAFVSHSGQFVLRVVPGDTTAGKTPMAVILELGSDGESYAKVREFPLVNRWAPVEACISDDAEVFTCDDWGQTGKEHVVVSY